MRHPDVSTPKTPVWAPWRFNLGDHWATINYLITRSFVLREEMLLSRYQHGQDFASRLQEIRYLLAAPERSSVVLVDEPGTHEPDGFDVWATNYWPTKETWKPNAGRRVCYQFDGISSAEDKNPPREDQRRILDFLKRENMEPVRLGSHMTLAAAVHELAEAQMFIGCDSGMSHVAHSVGTPMILVEYKLPIITTHRGKRFIHVHGTDALVSELTYLINLSF